MLSIGDIRQYISGLGIAADSNVYIGKLDNKKEQSIGVYPRKEAGRPNIALGGYGLSSYDTKRISLLIHWNKSMTQTEQTATALFEKIMASGRLKIGDTDIVVIDLQVPEPVYVGTDDNGVHEYVIWLDFIYQKGA